MKYKIFGAIYKFALGVLCIAGISASLISFAGLSHGVLAIGGFVGGSLAVWRFVNWFWEAIGGSFPDCDPPIT